MFDSFTYEHVGIKDVVHRDVSFIVVITMDKDVNKALGGIRILDLVSNVDLLNLCKIAIVDVFESSIRDSNTLSLTKAGE